MSKQKKAPAASEKRKLNAGEIIKPAAVLTVICLVIAALLGGANMLTAARIAQLELEKKEKSCLEVFPADEGQTVTFEEIKTLWPESGYDGYLAVSGDEVVGCVLVTAASGYNGPVQIMTGFDMTGKVTGIKVISHGETPGLGANAADGKFLSQFVSSTDAGSLAVTKDGGTIDAVTSATYSSRAVTDAINIAARQFEEMKAGGMLALPETNASQGEMTVSTADVQPSGSDTTENQNKGGAEQ